MQTIAEKLMRLAADQAYWSQQIAMHKKAGAEAIEKCTRSQSSGDIDFFKGVSCIEFAYSEHIDTNKHASVYEHYHFHETYDEMVAYGEICEHCQACREHKKKRTYASIRRGQVRAAITRIGKSLTPSIKE